MGAQRELALAARAPERVTHLVFVAPTLPITPSPPHRSHSFTDELETYDGWAKFNEHHWRRDFRDFVEFFFHQCLPEPHSTKQHDDLVGWGLQTDAERSSRASADVVSTVRRCSRSPRRFSARSS